MKPATRAGHRSRRLLPAVQQLRHSWPVDGRRGDRDAGEAGTDPQQLDQPTQGTHPDGVDTSALDHMLGRHQTIPEDRGLFLEETWRLHPAICAFTSELFYEGRLRPRPGLELQQIRSTGDIAGSGLRYRRITHSG